MIIVSFNYLYSLAVIQYYTMLYMNDINTLGMICQYDISNIRWVTVQARGRVAELLDELRQTVGAQGGGATRSMSTVYLYPIEKYK